MTHKALTNSFHVILALFGLSIIVQSVVLYSNNTTSALTSVLFALIGLNIVLSVVKNMLLQKLSVNHKLYKVMSVVVAITSLTALALLACMFIASTASLLNQF